MGILRSSRWRSCPICQQSLSDALPLPSPSSSRPTGRTRWSWVQAPGMLLCPAHLQLPALVSVHVFHWKMSQNCLSEFRQRYLERFPTQPRMRRVPVVSHLKPRQQLCRICGHPCHDRMVKRYLAGQLALECAPSLVFTPFSSVSRSSTHHTFFPLPSVFTHMSHRLVARSAWGAAYGGRSDAHASASLGSCWLWW